MQELDINIQKMALFSLQFHDLNSGDPEKPDFNFQKTTFTFYSI